MTAIDIIKTATGADVRFPFELKDQFRACFKSAKWDAAARCWKVGRRSVTRAEQWAEHVRGSGVLETIAAHEERDLAAEERDRLSAALRSLSDRLARSEAELGSIEALRTEAETLKASLEERHQQVAALAEKKAQRDAERARVQAEVNARVAEIVDLDRLRGVLCHMRSIRPGTAQGRQIYNESAPIVRAILEDLAGVGITSDTLWNIVRMNFNRIDRDGQPWRDAYTFRVMTADEGAEPD